MSIFTYLADNKLHPVKEPSSDGKNTVEYIPVEDETQAKRLVAELSQVMIDGEYDSVRAEIGERNGALAVVLESPEDVARLQRLKTELAENLTAFLNSPRFGEPLEIMEVHVPNEGKAAFCVIPEVTTGRALIHHLHELGADSIVSNYGGELAVKVTSGLSQLASVGALKPSKQLKLQRALQGAGSPDL